MLSLSSQSLSQAFIALEKIVKSHPISLAAVAIVSIMLLRRANEDYRAWLKLGPGGGPHNPVGYILCYALGLLASKDLKSSVCYESLASSKGNLSDVPIREGTAPIISKWLFPVRQLSARAGKERVQALKDMLNELAAKHEVIFSAPSLLEGGYSTALFLEANSEDGVARKKPARAREIFHYHDTEGSAHATLSPSDAKLLLDRGWGERHPLSGKLGIALSYVMIYSPRNDAEMDVLEMVAQAAIGYALERRNNGVL